MIMLDKIIKKYHYLKLNSLNDVEYHNVPVLSVTIMESIKIDAWARGGEFLLTSSNTMPDSEEAQINLLNLFVDLKISALAIKFSSEAFTLSSSFLEEAEKHEFAIFEIPNNLRYLDIMNPINQDIFIEQKQDLLKERVFSYLIFNPDLSLPEFESVKNYFSQDQKVLALTLSPQLEDFNKLDAIFNKYYLFFTKLQIKGLITDFLYLRKINSVDFLLLSNRNSLDESNISKQLRNQVNKSQKQEKIRIGISRVKPISNAHSAVVEANFCIQASDIMSGSNIIHFEKVELFKLMTDLYGDGLDDFISDTLKDVTDHETLMMTLIHFFQNNEKIKQTSEQLFIHVNTLHYRLKRIELLTELNLSSVHDKTKLYLSTMCYWMLKK